MASLFKRGKNYYAQFESGRSRRQISLRTPERRKAEQVLRRLEVAAGAGSWNPMLALCKT